jgi:hypothetical protein
MSQNLMCSIHFRPHLVFLDLLVTLNLSGKAVVVNVSFLYTILYKKTDRCAVTRTLLFVSFKHI